MQLQLPLSEKVGVADVMQINMYLCCKRHPRSNKM